VNAEDVEVEIDTQQEKAGGDKDDWDDMTYREGEIPPEIGGFDVSDVEDDDVFDEVLRDLIQTKEQIRDPTAEKLDFMFSDLHERFRINIQEDDTIDQRVNSIYDSLIYKFKSHRDLNTRLVDQEVSKALGVSSSSKFVRERRERSPLWNQIPKVPRSDSAPLVRYFNDDLKYMLNGPKEYLPSTKEVATYEEIPNSFLEEETFLDIFSEEEVDREDYNFDAFIGIINVNERSKGFYRRRQLNRKPRVEVYSSSRILSYVEVNSEYQHLHGYVDYHVIRTDKKDYRFSELDYLKYSSS
jgi:hypothetical protein